ncbi:MAG TPA: lipocalin-like domain-containing protein [Blastocatellia bacterium]|nr:lipocalin-like domain-containing protein [Blastocatellia bacterium]
MGTLVGAWKLVSFEETSPDGERTQPYGPDPVGILIYTGTGYMCVQIMRRDRPALPDLAFEEIGAAQIKEVVGGFTAFSGTYQADPDNHIVIHHVQCHVLPGSVGKDLRRRYELEGDTLVLWPTPTRAVTWERVK